MITHDTILGISTILYLALFFLYIVYFAARRKGILRTAWYCLLVTFALQTAGIGLRWVESYRLGMGHAPLSNYYESLIFFSWAISLIMIVMRKRLYPVITFTGAAASLALMAYASLSPAWNGGSSR
jgi:ABC-type transport system involved in cytochrome c biogenesis permease subunit